MQAPGKEVLGKGREDLPLIDKQIASYLKQSRLERWNHD